MAEIDIIQAIEGVFRPVFKGSLKTWWAWMAFLKHLFSLPVESQRERKLIRQCCGYEKMPPTYKRRRTRAHKECYLICGRRSGKSFISAMIAVFMAVFYDWRPYLAAGERAVVVIVATDRIQAKIIFNYISGILGSSKLLRGMVEQQKSEEVRLKNCVDIVIKTASYRSVRGYTVAVAILEEVAFYRSEYSANPDKEILSALRPALATIPESLLLGISTPYMRAGVLWDQFRKYYGKAGDPLIWRAPSLTMNPTLSTEFVSKQIKADPQAAAAEWNAEFRSDVEAFMPGEAVENVVVPGRFELPRIEKAHYAAFLDPAGGSGSDSFTLAVAHKEKSGNIILDCIRERRPRFSPKEAVKEFSDTLKAYGITSAHSDRFGGEWVREAFRDHKIEIQNSELSKSEIYLEFLPMILNKSVELLDMKRLTGQLVNLERKTRSGGKDSVDHPIGLHDDIANAAAGACVLTGRSGGGEFYYKLSSVDMYGETDDDFWSQVER